MASLSWKHCTSSGMLVLNLNIPITSDYQRCTKGLFSYCVEKYHTTLFHTRPPQNQYSRPPHLNKSLNASFLSFTMSTHFTIDSCLLVKHTEPVKAPAYTRALPDIGNEECVEMVIEHEVHLTSIYIRTIVDTWLCSLVS